MKKGVLIVGSVALDSIETFNETRERVLGGSASYFSLSASLFAPVSLVGVIGDDFPQEYIEFYKQKNIDIKGLQKADGKTFFWRGRYSKDFSNRQTLDTQLNVFKNFSPQLPAEYKEISYICLGNIHPALQLKVLDEVKNPRFIAADTMNFWIEGERQLLNKVLSKIDLLLINDEEARLLTGINNLKKAAKEIQKLGPKHLVIKKGEHGAFLFSLDSVFYVPAYPIDEVLDPTGAGDSFAGALMGYVASQPELNLNILKSSMIYATALASFTVEGFSVEKLVTLKLDNINQRVQFLNEMTRFPNL